MQAGTEYLVKKLDCKGEIFKQEFVNMDLSSLRNDKGRIRNTKEKQENP
jgi:hypothetical protein